MLRVVRISRLLHSSSQRFPYDRQQHVAPIIIVGGGMKSGISKGTPLCGNRHVVLVQFQSTLPYLQDDDNDDNVSTSRAAAAAAGGAAAAAATVVNRNNNVARLLLQHHQHQLRPVTPWERVRAFPKNVWQLWQDYLRYQNIVAASKAKRNAWTLQRHHVLLLTNDKMNVDQQQQQQQQLPLPLLHQPPHDHSTARIPRRQYQQLQQFQQDFYQVLPIILLSAPPIIGYLPLIFAIAAPRQVLSRQFHNEYEVVHFTQLSYQQRQEHYQELGRLDVVKQLLDHHHHGMIKQSSVSKEDAAGPILDLAAVYTSVFSDHDNHGSILSPSNSNSTRFTSWKQVPRSYLNHLGLASGIFQQYPSWVGKLLVAGCSRRWIQKQLQGIATAIRLDDTLLLEEGHDYDKCQSLTDLEVLDACLKRGLPVLSIPYDDMRICLTHHLQMIRDWSNSHLASTVSNTRKDDEQDLLLLHIAPLRYLLKHTRVNVD